MTGMHAWAALGAAVIGYDVFAREGETLSEAYDRFLLNHKTIATVAVVVTALHLLNMIEDRHDPVHIMFLGMKRVRF